MTERQSGFIVCDKAELPNLSQSQLLNRRPLSLTEFSPNRVTAISVTKKERSGLERQMLYRINPEAPVGSVITGRAQEGEKICLHQPFGTVLLPWCTDESFAHWIALLQGTQTKPIYPDWFVYQNQNDYERKSSKRIAIALRELRCLDTHELKLPNIAKLTKFSSRQFSKLFPGLFGLQPGLLLRAIAVFAMTAELMQQENEILSNRRRGHSPLAQAAGDYRRRLQRLIGISYSELLLASQTEHWAVVWMRKWRERRM